MIVCNSSSIAFAIIFQDYPVLSTFVKSLSIAIKGFTHDNKKQYLSQVAKDIPKIVKKNNVYDIEKSTATGNGLYGILNIFEDLIIDGKKITDKPTDGKIIDAVLFKEDI